MKVGSIWNLACFLALILVFARPIAATVLLTAPACSRWYRCRSGVWCPEHEEVSMVKGAWCCPAVILRDTFFVCLIAWGLLRMRRMPRSLNFIFRTHWYRHQTLRNRMPEIWSTTGWPVFCQEFGQELAEVQAAAAAAACDMLDSPLKTQREDEDATRWVEDPISIFYSFQKGGARWVSSLSLWK